MAMLTDTPDPTPRHSPLDDALGLFSGCVMMALSVHLLRAGGLITGQIAGLSLVGSYAAGVDFGLVFFVLNLPFYGLAVRRMGWVFTAKTFAAVALVSALSWLMPLVFAINTLHPGAAAVMGGVIGGAGLLALFRHGATLGGIGILGMYLQDKGVIRAGQLQMGFDACVFALAMLLLDWKVVAWSLLGAVVLNLIITMNHRRDRYIAR
ncbi:YitT family protein [Aliiroseovarius sp.]|uniref:YitT family protein n=1 Tax=Aliiroseovarius sp. TaxID=1872442 RepID=UPI00260162E8|nr:YitT family protein [Aliiroseovarius sp.]